MAVDHRDHVHASRAGGGDAVAARTGPAAALDVDAATVSEWPWLPDAPVTRLAEVDADVAQRWRHAAGAPVGVAAVAAVFLAQGSETQTAS
ncbi:hypothetical protein ACFV1N_25100 [Streptosporangium canum]|uniref:hypothetical protein n=1 Tax=Streptosporangium canum TaxID=324952 RepID=UPI00369B5C0A